MTAPDNNPYAAPTAPLTEVDAPAGTEVPPFFAVSQRKLVVMLLGTMGLYQVYWAYKQWACHRIRSGDPIWPVMRAIFQVFFTHSLTAEVEHRLQRLGIRHDWQPAMLATILVATMIGQSIIQQFLGPRHEVLAQAVVAGVLCVQTVLVSRMQTAINLAVEDPEGAGNARITVWNVLWLLLGALLWLSVLLRVLALTGVLPNR